MTPRQTIPHVDPQQFIVPTTKEAAYLLGFLWADGSLYAKGHSQRITVEITAEDGQGLAPIFRRTGPWCESGRQRHQEGKPFGRPLMCFATNNRPLIAHLLACGYGKKANASQAQILATIPIELRHYFWRGYLDGDGCIHLGAGSLKCWYVQVAFWSTIDQDWSAVQEMLKEAGVRKHIVRRYERPKANGSIHRSSVLIVTRKDDIPRLLRYLYRGDQIGLVRKREKYLEIEAVLSEKDRRRVTEGKSLYRGVTHRSCKGKPGHRWYAHIKHLKRGIHLGTFDTEEEAALAYNAMAVKLWGETAILNEVTARPHHPGDGP